ncbi:MAG: response regulator transcription factor [Terriglobia bacterium]|jgi:two-component system alkaline phosphatase synthesis response regulator PhoP
MAQISKVLVVEDDISVTTGISIYLKKAGYTVVSTFDGASGLEAAKKESPDFIILDIMLPKMNGYEVCKGIRKMNPRVPIIMLTSKSDEGDKVFGLGLGADDYITKPFSFRELEARMKAVARRAEKDAVLVSKQPQLKHRDILLDLNTREVLVKKKALTLTPKEFDLMKHFMQNPELVFSRDQLLDAVWGYTFEGYDRTIDTHINRLRNKIEKDPSAPEYIISVYGVGYKLV